MDRRQTGEAGVKIFGPIHGGVFVAYMVLALLTARVQRWSFWTTVFALGASIPPFFTVWFEMWAKRPTGRFRPSCPVEHRPAPHRPIGGQRRSVDQARRGASPMRGKMQGMSPADTYTHGHHDSVLRSHRWRTAENSAGYLLPHLRSGQTPARHRLRSRHDHPRPGRLVAPGQTVGLDREVSRWSPPRPAPPSRVCDNVGFTVGDVYQLDFPDDSFDIVHAHQVLQHLTDPVAALREMRRVCRPGGWSRRGMRTMRP